MPGADDHLITRRRAIALFGAGAGALVLLCACNSQAPVPPGPEHTPAPALRAAEPAPVAAAEALHYLSLQEVGRRIASKQISPVAVTERMLARIGRLDSRLQSYATVMAT